MNPIGTGNVFQLAYDDICELCRRYSRGKFKTGKNSKERLSLFLKSTAKTRVLRAEISNVFKNSNAGINDSLNSKLVVLQVKEKHEEFEEIVFPRCQKKHIAMDFPLDSLTICGICDLNHSTYCCPFLPRMKETYQRDLGVAANSFQQSWKPWPTCMVLLRPRNSQAATVRDSP